MLHFFKPFMLNFACKYLQYVVQMLCWTIFTKRITFGFTLISKIRERKNTRIYTHKKNCLISNIFVLFEYYINYCNPQIIFKFPII